ncbi:exported hypothetical protein [Verrucomicrobia bacterium]|nr:exported hypothetical protein [Verrucomicrobiota bacterium]
MKNSPLTTILLGVLAVIAFWSLVLCGMYVHRSRQLVQLKNQAAAINYRQNAINALVADAVAYSKQNPAIDPILVSAGLKTNAAGAKPTTK